jgi:hypothetical protein
MLKIVICAEFRIEATVLAYGASSALFCIDHLRIYIAVTTPTTIRMKETIIE